MAINSTKLRVLMLEKGFENYEDFAKAIGVTRDTVGNVINQKNFPSYKFVSNSYDVLDLTPEEGAEIFFSENLRDTKEKQKA